MASVLTVLAALYILLGGEQDYDERQTAVQGRAAKYGMGAFLIYSLLWAAYSFSDGETPVHMGAVLLAGCSLVLVLYLTAIIWQDAYNPRNFPGFPWFLLLMGIANLVFFGIAGNRGEGWIAFSAGIVLLWAGVLLLVRRLWNRAEG